MGRCSGCGRVAIGTGYCMSCRSNPTAAHFDMIGETNDLLLTARKFGHQLRDCCDESCPIVEVGGGLRMPLRVFCGIVICCAPFTCPCVTILKVGDYYNAKNAALHNAPPAAAGGDTDIGHAAPIDPSQPLITKQPGAPGTQESTFECKDCLYDCSVSYLICCARNAYSCS